jgi:putative polyketide hydroxylase
MEEMTMAMPDTPGADEADERVPVLIVGGGYAGLSMSAFLSRWGIRTLLVDRHAGVPVQGRARGINPRTMEIYRSMGLAGAVTDAGKPFTGDRGVARCETVAGEWTWFFEPDATERYREWTAGEFVLADQSDVEPILIADARAHGAEHRFSTVLTSFEADDDGVNAIIEDLPAGTRRRVRADYLIAADGHRSEIRERLGITQPGATVTADLVFILFEADLSDVVRQRPVFLVVHNPQTGGAGFVTTAAPGRWGLGVRYDPRRESAQEFAGQRGIDVVRAAVGRSGLDVRIIDVAAFQEGVGVADRYRHGRVFLVGDSAHVWPPAGAMGANSAVHDAHNLAWKLAAVLRGWAGPGLLGSYEAERRPVELALADLTMRRQQARFGQGQDAGDIDDLICILGQRYDAATPFAERMPEHAEAGLRAPHLWLAHPPGAGPRTQVSEATQAPGRAAPHGRPVALHDLFGTGFTLLAGAAGAPWRTAASRVADATGIPVTAYCVGAGLTDPDGQWPTRSGARPDGAILVRPDGYVAWISQATPSDPAATLARALDPILDRASTSQP